MPRDITVTFDDGSSHVYRNAPDDVTPDSVQARAQKEFGKTVQSLDGGRAAPAAPAAAAPSEVPMGRRVIQFVRPTVEALGGAGGALLGGAAGTFGAGPVGTIAGGMAGGGLGYGLAKSGLDVLEQQLGYTKPPESVSQAVIGGVKDVATGAAEQGVGMALAPVISKAVGKVVGLGTFSKDKAANIARNALGPDLPEVLNALKAAQGQGVSAAQATANINSPTWQALIDRATARDPRFLQALEKSQGEVSLNALSKLASGATATEVRAYTEGMKRGLNTFLEPVKEEALKRANLGRNVAQYEAQAEALRAGATGKVEDVRRLVRAGEVAGEAAQKGFPKTPSGELIGLPRIAGKYTYPGELAEAADRWASDAAKASLDLGQGARFSQSAADALRSAGIKPLESAPLIAKVQGLTANPEFAGNDVMQAAVTNLSRDIAEWTGKGGIIDARALDAIRKNSVNAAVRDLLKGQDPSIQREAAASVMTRIKPALINAIEDAGGVGYRQYLEDYAKGMRQISEKKLTGEALKLWKTNKDEFVRLVQGEAPEAVEKILGRGNYNIAQELADDTLSVLQQQAQKRLTELSVKGQVTAGQEALKELLLDNMSKFRLPSYLSALSSTTNRALAILENKIGRNTMTALTESLKTPGGAAQLLETLPAAERNRVLKLLNNPNQWKPTTRAAVGGAVSGATNALAPESENALAQ
jgi:hypothetical protein